MSDLFWLSDDQSERLVPYFLRSRGKARVDDRRVLSGILHVQRNGLRWRDTPTTYSLHKALYNRHVRWTRNGVFARIFVALAEEAGPPERIVIDSTHLKAHRTAASLLQKKGFAVGRAHQRWSEIQAPCRLQPAWPGRWSCCCRRVR